VHTTGSRTLFGIRLTAVRLLAVAGVLLLGMVGVFAALGSHQAEAGNADAILTVNSTANTDDGVCGGAPNTSNTGNCTFREGINAVNAGLATKLNFHPPVFSVATPGVIQIDDGDFPNNAAGNCLPAIERDGVTIDNTSTGVVIDGDSSLDSLSPIFCDAAIHVHAVTNGFDFAFLGGKHFTFRDIGGDALNIDGNDFCTFGTCSLGDVTISGLITRNITDDGIELRDTTNLSNIMVTNNDIEATYFVPLFGGPFGDVGVAMFTNGTDLTDNTVAVTGNRIIGNDEAVEIDFAGDLASVISASVSDNSFLIGLGDQAVELDYCDATNCDAGGTGNAINFDVNNNNSVQGQSDGVAMEINADGTPAVGSGATHVNVNVNGNGLTDAETGHGVDVDVNVCCDSSDSTSDIMVDGNDEIVAETEGVNINVDLGCGDDNVSNVGVTNNDRITSQNNDGIEIDADIGEAAAGCDFGVPPADPTDDSDGNESNINVDDNGRIDGEDEGIDIRNEVGAGAVGDGDDNTATVSTSGNDDVSGDEEGIMVDNDAGSDAGDSSDDNEAYVTADGNGRVRGADDEGMDLNADAGTQGGDNALDDGDDNHARIDVLNNTEVVGSDDDGIEVDIFAGGATSGSTGNTTLTNITGNGDLIGEHDSGGAGIDVSMNVCCDPANTNTLNIMNTTGDIIGRDDMGIDIFANAASSTGSIPAGAGATHITTIQDNGLIRGDDDDGIEYDATTSCPDGLGDRCPILNSLNILTIGDGADADTAGNNLSNSEDEGIDICCGAFDLPGTPGTKSVISNNTINENRDHGIEAHNTTGLNIEHNTIAMNGDDPSVDRGIEIDCTDFNAVDLDPGLGVIPFTFPCNHNKISQNEIFDNIGMGIDLNGDTVPPTAVATHGVGCTPFANGVSPNDCIPFPVITLIASGDKVGGTACSLCTVELFLADAVPVDQTGPFGRQHGEGKTFQISGEADADGDFSIILPCGLSAGDITATGTDKLKNTSEFSANAPFLGSRSCATATPTVTNTVPAPPTATQGPPTATLPPPATATTPPTATPTKDCGDVNDDGLVNSVDSLFILQFTAALIDTLINQASADVNNSGEISSVDSALILQKEAGLIPQSALICA